MEKSFWLQACAPGLRERLGAVVPSEQVVVSTPLLVIVVMSCCTAETIHECIIKVISPVCLRLRMMTCKDF